MQVKILKMFRKEIDTKRGKAMQCNIQVEEYPERWINGFESASNKTWKIGDKVEIVLNKKTINDKEYLNYKTPKNGDIDRGAITKIITDTVDARLKEMLKYIDETYQKKAQ